jgi:ABC-type histidine transport system ATPase subunit
MRIKNVEIIPLHLPVKRALVESGGTFSQFGHVIVKSTPTTVFTAWARLIKEVLDVMSDLADGGMTMVVVTHEMGFATPRGRPHCFYGPRGLG